MRKFLFVFFMIIFEVALIGAAAYLYLTNPTNLPFTIALAALAVILFIVVVFKYNKTIRYQNKIKESFSLVDIHLKLRFDLIPNLVSVVKKYAEHEKDVLATTTKLRNLAVNATDDKTKLDYANKLVPQMKNIFAIAEGYPELKADKLFKSLMEQLVEVEDRIVSARRIYDSNVAEFNTYIEVFPNSIISKSFGFKREELFRIDAGENIAPLINLEAKW